ncbi:MAG: GNAT family N-acetyltransferase [Chitinophagaceae bacterium]
MVIRKIKTSDSEKISDLLTQLEYPDSAPFLQRKIRLLADNPNEHAVVAVDELDEVVGFISIHIIAQIALEKDFARISYFCVDESRRSAGIGKLLEENCEKVARANNCDRIEVHCHSRREKAHLFYYRQGYAESPKYLIKKL